MTRQKSFLGRRAEARRKKVINILESGPKTAIQISTALRECRYEDYSFWAPGDIHSILPKMLKIGEVEKVGMQRGRVVYALAKGERS